MSRARAASSPKRSSISSRRRRAGWLRAVSAPVPLAPMAPITLVENFEHDDEMREVFFEEAREVVEPARARAASWPRRRSDLESLLTTAAARLPHAQGQLAHGRAEGVRRGRLGLRAALQHAAGRAARGRPAAARVHALGAGLPRRLGRGHCRASLGASATSAKSRPRPSKAGGRRRHRAGVGYRPADRHAGRPAEPRRSRPWSAQEPAAARAAARPSPRTSRSRPRPLQPRSPGRARVAAPRRCRFSSRRLVDASAMFDRFRRCAAATRCRRRSRTSSSISDPVGAGRPRSRQPGPQAAGMIQNLAPSERAAARWGSPG